MPSLLNDVLREAIERRDGLRLDPEPIRLPTAGAQIIALGIDTLVSVSSRVDGSRFATQLLREIPDLRLVVIASDSREVVVFQPPLLPRALHNPSLDHFLDTLGQAGLTGLAEPH